MIEFLFIYIEMNDEPKTNKNIFLYVFTFCWSNLTQTQ